MTSSQLCETAIAWQFYEPGTTYLLLCSSASSLPLRGSAAALVLRTSSTNLPLRGSAYAQCLRPDYIIYNINQKKIKKKSKKIKKNLYVLHMARSADTQCQQNIKI